VIVVTEEDEDRDTELEDGAIHVEDEERSDDDTPVEDEETAEDEDDTTEDEDTEDEDTGVVPQAIVKLLLPLKEVKSFPGSWTVRPMTPSLMRAFMLLLLSQSL